MKKVVLLFIIITFNNFVYPCPTGGSDEPYYYNFFHQEMISDSSLFPFLFVSESMFYYSTYLNSLPDPNIKEWKSFIGASVTLEDIRYVVYTLDQKIISQILKKINGVKKINIPKSELRNSLVELWLKNKKTRIINYLIFAKKCEDQSYQTEYSWNYTVNRDPEIIDALIDEGLLLYKEEKNKFLKLRYAYQLVRLAHYGGYYDRSIEFFDEYCEPLKLKNYIYYRALEQKAGALNAMKSSESAYLFSRVFDKCPDRMRTCLISFKFTDRDLWNKSFLHCKNNAEKSVFYAMRALKPEGYAIEEMENIYRIDPSSPYLELLLVRQIHQFERETFSIWDFTSLDVPWFPLDIDNYNQVLRLKELAYKISNDPEIPNSDLWKIAVAYLEFLNLDLEKCRNYIAEIQPSSKYYQECKVIDFVARLSSLDSVDNDVEIRFTNEYNQNDYLKNCSHIMPLMKDLFSVLYYKQNDLAKSYLCHNGILELREYLDIELINDLIEFLKTKQPNAFEKMLLSDYDINDLYEMKGTYYFQRNELQKAIAAFSRLPESYKNVYYDNPEYFNDTLFSGSIRHYFNTPFGQQSDKVYKKFGFLNKEYNKLTLAKQLLYLEELVQQQPQKAGVYYYLIGNVWNNISPYGWYRPVLYYYASYYLEEYNGRNPKKGRIANYKTFTYNSFYYYNPEIAINYFEKAIDNSESKEFIAKLYFMAAKAEQYLYYIEGEKPDYDFVPTKKRPNHQKYFSILSNEFRETDYYKELIDECSLFRYYCE